MNLSYFLKLTVRFHIILSNPHLGFYHEKDKFRSPARHTQCWGYLHQKGNGLFEEKEESQVNVNNSRQQELGAEETLQEEGRKWERERHHHLLTRGAFPPQVIPPPQGWEATEYICHISKHITLAGAGHSNCQGILHLKIINVHSDVKCFNISIMIRENNALKIVWGIYTPWSWLTKLMGKQVQQNYIITFPLEI